MIKELPEGYHGIDQIAPEITSLPQLALYYALLVVLLLAAFYLASSLSSVGPVSSPIILQPPLLQNLGLASFLLTVSAFVLSVLFYHLLQFGVFGFFDMQAVYRSRSRAHGRRLISKQFIPVYLGSRAIPTWLSSVWVPNRASPRNPYLLMVILPLASTLLVLYGLAYLSQLYIVPGLGLDFAIVFLLDVALYGNQLFLFLRLSMFPSSAYFVDRQSGLYVYDRPPRP
jgi:hypothetical protein